MTTTATKQYQQLIGGRRAGAASGATFEDKDPFTGETFAVVSAGGAEDARAAVAAASAAFPGWAKTTPGERQGLFLAAASILERRGQEIVDMLARETGCTFGFGMFQLGFTTGLLKQAASLGYLPIGQIIPSDIPGALAMGIREPVGVVGAIAPWNAALILSLRSITAPIAFGNTIVLKPSEWSPIAGGLIWGEIFEEAGFPPGVLNIVPHAPGAAAPIADVLVADPAVRRLNFTGSTATGRKLAEAAGRHLKRIVLELGGFNPLIVLDDADVDYAVDAAAFGSFLHQGQICMSVRRVLVQRAVADAFTDRLTAKVRNFKLGDPKEHDTIIGPLINAEAVATVDRRVQEAVARGARVLLGGAADGPCYQATIVTEVPAGTELAESETFGPVVAIEVVDDDETAVERANATPYGLSAGIITTDNGRGFDMARRVQAGIVHVNDQPVGDEPQMPFGGVKDSGWGRFGGAAAMDEFTELRWITLQSGTRPFPF